MYAETDFLLALVTNEDWLTDAAEAVYNKQETELWTSQFTLVELLLVAYREGMDTEQVVVNAANLVEIRGDETTPITAATYVEDYGFTPFDAVHFVESDGERIVTSDETYDGFAPRLDLKEHVD